MKKTPKKFNCAVEIMLTVAEMGWKNCKTHMVMYSDNMPFYNEALADDALKAIDDARKLTTVQQRNANSKDSRIDLKDTTLICLNNFQSLKNYIFRGYPPAKAEVNLEAAGGSLYLKAAGNNWSAVRSLLDLSSTFINKNQADLVNRNIMPKTFQAKYLKEMDACLKNNTGYNETEIDNSKETTVRQQAIVDVYDATISMLKDGHRFNKIPSLNKTFTFAGLLAIVKGNSSAGVRGLAYTLLGEQKIPVVGAFITTADGKSTATTNKKGRFTIPRIESGSQLFIIRKVGMETVEINKQIKPGVKATLNVPMTPTAAGEKLKIA